MTLAAPLVVRLHGRRGRARTDRGVLALRVRLGPLVATTICAEARLPARVRAPAGATLGIALVAGAGSAWALARRPMTTTAWACIIFGFFGMRLVSALTKFPSVLASVEAQRPEGASAPGG